MSAYFVFRAAKSDYFCGIERDDPGLDKVLWKIMEGHRVGAGYPAQVTFKMGRGYRGITVGDVIQNRLRYPLGSAKLRGILEREAGAEIEYLPFTLENHKGRTASEDCVVVNVIGSQDCADTARSVGQESLSEPGTYLRLRKLHLDPAKVDPDARIFRVRQFPSLLVIREDLRAVLEGERVTGAEYLPMGADL
jgi:hypothetical protein